ncbi:SRPBCC family protein [Tardiphaga sp.]|jgi:p-cumate 2,3-dioxygenase alpha subunit|uniref:aromatic ring-hydroxylating oxygenase subunit alpha n=1 Tax=Tardiphaga sp. TaxID=1926292 RepID=UPI0037D9DBDB
MNAFTKMNTALQIDEAQKIFKVSRQAFTDPTILEAERSNIFDKCWLYLGHSSELDKPGDFVTRSVGGRNILFARDGQGELKAMLNTCPHRGAQVCREKHGRAKSFQCFYHGWVFGLDGTLRSQPGEESYAEDFKSRSTSNMQQVPRFESYRGLNFICFDAKVESLTDYLGPVLEYLDVICDQAEEGMTIVGGTQEYSMRANWKLLTENSIDGYHALTTHATYLDYLKATNGSLAPVAFAGTAYDLGRGHAVLEYKAPWGRPVAQWIPSWGEDGKRELDRLYARLLERFGKERADRIATYNRNLFIFPNLVINDIMAVTVRTYYPTAPDHMTISAWALAPKEETDWARKYRLFNFLEFLGPGGFATPDDVEALEQCQRGFRNAGEAQWNDISKGMGKESPSYDDEAQMRAFWSNWNERVFQVPA